MPDVDEARQLRTSSNDEHRLANTVWNFLGTATKVTFQPDHQVEFDDTDATGYWELQGNHLQFDCNRFTMYELTWDSREEMSGHWYRLNDPAEKGPSSLRLVGPA